MDEIDLKYRTDLSSLYKNEEELDKDKQKIQDLKDKLCSYKGKVLSSSSTLLEVLKLLEEYDTTVTRVYVYYFFKSDLDLTDDKTRSDLETFDNVRLGNLKDINFVNLEIKKINKSLWNKYKNENKELLVYDYHFNEIIRFKKHKLKDHEERFLTNLYPILGSESNTYDVLTNADFKGQVIMVDGKEEILTENNYYKYITSKDRNVRREASSKLMIFYKEHNHTLSELYKMFIKQNNIFSKLNHYKDSFDAEMFENDIKDKVYLNLINIVKSKREFLDRYALVFKRDLGYEELYGYDMLYNKHLLKEYSFEEAVSICENAIKPLGDKYASLFKKGIESRWIDVFAYEHKNSMQYSIAAYKVTPLIHMNFNNTFEDINTLIHEMGHSINTVLTTNNVNYVYGEPSTLVTETAAITNEMLLATYVLNTSNDKEEKLFILNHLLSMIRSTIFFQTNIAEFELECVRKDNSGEILTSEVLNDLWKDITKNYTSNNVIYNEESSKYTWSRIPHIFQGGGFYVYKYALGLCLAASIASRIIENKDNFVDKYINYLSNGSSMSDYDMFKSLGLDITKNSYIEEAFKLFDRYLDEYDKLVD